ncbi:flavodoxin family protein [Clostridium boliviensis]|uniref:Flavodoxin family protein n=1 Tax=Clostridium boliviensis TaxID=318465 RepID=A0ABU4GL36_9CLOT|nr:flavodoxin family protein [Clostridium boliviensis]MDW2797700.1 flavodoxin family protein [Clostridium boliviensis]
MKVTAILGSPRKKGDCFNVIEMLQKSFNRVEETQIDYIYLNDIELGFCKSCLLCYTKGEQYCPHKEVTTMLLNKMLECDVVIFASPVYEQHVTALMKNFYDNFSFMFHRPRFFHKRAILVSSTGGSGLKETLSYMKMCAIGWGFQIAGTVGVCGATLKTDEAYKQNVQNNINHLVNNLFKNKESTPTLYQLAMFRAMQSKALGSSKKKDISFEYWKEHGWFEKEYYTNAKISLFKKIYSRFIRKIMKKLITTKLMIIR